MVGGVCSLQRFLGASLQASQEGEELATRDLTRAVVLTRTALDDPVHSRSNVTLVTVLLLSMYEVGIPLSPPPCSRSAGFGHGKRI